VQVELTQQHLFISAFFHYEQRYAYQMNDEAIKTC
jgi:hypothetical protein